MKENMGSGLPDQEHMRGQALELCRRAIELYTLCRKEFSESDPDLSDMEQRFISSQSSILLEEEDGVRIGGPFSENTKLRYGHPYLSQSKDKGFYIEGNDIDENDPEVKEFETLVATRFAEQGIPFYSLHQ